MLPFALKVVWFCLSFTGIGVCWVVLWTFSRATGSYWGGVLYSVFATLLQGIFCLGMIYDMNPFKMPRAFCIVQTFVIYYSAWSLAGVCAAFTFATSSSVLWPSSAKRPETSILAWKNKYYFPVFVFPLACLSISLPILLRANAIQPTEDLHCDASRPEWGRFLGYAGLPMIPTIPCLLLSAAAARRVHQMHRHIQRSHSSFGRERVSTARLPSGSQSSSERNTPSERVKSPLINTPPDSEIPDFPRATSARDAPLHDALDVMLTVTFDTSQKLSQTWEVLEVGDAFNPRGRMRSMTLSPTTYAVPPPKPNLAPAIWRLILFQIAFFTVQCLAALSTVIDVARRRPRPTPFGSQHVALILAGWGPAVVFGHLPAVRRRLMFWKR